LLLEKTSHLFSVLLSPSGGFLYSTVSRIRNLCKLSILPGSGLVWLFPLFVGPTAILERWISEVLDDSTAPESIIGFANDCIHCHLPLEIEAESQLVFDSVCGTFVFFGLADFVLGAC
jgi:hypothetical protein